MFPQEFRNGEQQQNQQIAKLIGDFPKSNQHIINNIVQATLSKKKICGELNLQQVANHFGINQGRSFSGGDGFYRVSGQSEISESDVIRVKTVPQGRTLWYPTSISQLYEVMKEFHRAVGYKAWVEAGSVVQSGKSPKPTDMNKYLDDAEEQAMQNYTLVDFGSGDFRLPLVAASCGIQSTGIEIDEELFAMGEQNIAEAKQKNILNADISKIKGSFLDDSTIEAALNRKTPESRAICYLFTVPITWELLPKLLPHLKKDDFIFTYTERLSESKEFEQLKDRLEIKMETKQGISKAPINIYRVK